MKLERNNEEKKINLKKVETNVNLDEYISNISNIIGVVRNITLKAKITNINKIEFDEVMMII